MAEMATPWRRSPARPTISVAELLDRVAAVPRGTAHAPAVCDHEPGVSVDALLRREGRAAQGQDRSARPHGGAPAQTRRAAVAVSTFLAAGSVVGVALSSSGTAQYELGTTAQPVDAPPVGQGAPAPVGGQAPVLDTPAAAGALAAGSEPSPDWTAVAFPPAVGSSAGDPAAGSAGAPEPSAPSTASATSGDEASNADADARDDDESGSDDDRDGGTRSSASDSRDSDSPSDRSTSRDDDEVVLAEGGSATPAPAPTDAVIPGGVAAGDADADDAESGAGTGGGAGSVDDADDGDSTPATDDSIDEGPDAADGSGTDTGSDTDGAAAAGDSDSESGSSTDEEQSGTAVSSESDGDSGDSGDSGDRGDSGGSADEAAA